MKPIRLFIVLAITLLITAINGYLVSAAPVVYTSTFFVNIADDTNNANRGNGSCADANGNCSLRAAIEEANTLRGNSLITLSSNIVTYTLKSQLVVKANMTIQGAGTADSVIDAKQNDRVFWVQSGPVVINDVTITGGRAPDGPDGVPIEGEYGAPGGDGGGILNNGDLELNRVLVTENRTGDGGDNYFTNSEGEQFFHSCPGRGGNGAGIASIANLDINNSPVRLVLNDTTIYDNQVGKGGRGSFGNGDDGQGGVVAVVHANIIGGSTRAGSVVDLTFEMTNSTISHNPGGFFYDYTVYEPEPGCYGRQSTDTNPNSGEQLMPTTLFGEPVDHFADVEIGNFIENSTIVNNFNRFGRQVNVGSFRHHFPGRLHYYNYFKLPMSNSIVSEDCFSASIIYPAPDYEPVPRFESYGYNLFLTPTGSNCLIVPEAGTGRAVATDIYADDLGVSYIPRDDGGPVLTHWLYVGSPAIDAGNCPNVTTDQRGRPRPIDQPYVANAVNGCDIGAVEIEEVTGINYSHRGVEPSTGSPFVLTFAGLLLLLTSGAIMRRLFKSTI